MTKKTPPPINAFDWMRYTTEERERRGEVKDLNNTARKRSLAASKTVEKTRLVKPKHGVVNMSAKTAAMVALKPTSFIIYSRVRKNEGK